MYTVFVFQTIDTETKVKSFLKEIFVKPGGSGHMVGELGWLITTFVTQ